jgi:cysteinyl-tRNA synthetase
LTLSQGVPTHDAEGKELSKSLRKTLRKELEKHTRLHEQYLKSQAEKK